LGVIFENVCIHPPNSDGGSTVGDSSKNSEKDDFGVDCSSGGDVKRH
jgi:hypothetical protein